MERITESKRNKFRHGGAGGIRGQTKTMETAASAHGQVTEIKRPQPIGCIKQKRHEGHGGYSSMPASSLTIDS